MAQKSNSHSEESRARSSTCSSSLEEKFAHYDKLIQQGYRFFAEGYNDDCLDGHDDDDADCNFFNCC